MVATRFAVAIHILLLLACRQRCGPATSHLIAESVNTNPVVVRRITGQLARAGLVHVRRGPGGAELTRPPEQITLCDIWTAMNTDKPGPMLPLHAFPNQECAIGQQIHTVLGQAFATVEQAMEAALQRTTLAGLMESLQAKVAA
jgi:Rrf2 family protein